jgi:hypothetical protein
MSDSSKSTNLSLLNTIFQSSRLAGALAWLGGVWYLIQAWRASHFLESILDEGAYLYKGYLFMSGQYSLYQPYGPWSNHMPLAFLIPGSIQAWIEPGIRTGRYFSIFATLLMLLGVWLLVRRLAGNWWAAGAVWMLVWNPATAKMYSIAVSQVLVASMLVWALLLVLGEDRPLWQILLGSVMAGLIVMTRINMLPVLPLFILYIFWEHGTRAGILSSLVGGLTFLLGHALYWPDIMQMWARLPRAFTPFLDVYRIPKEAKGSGRTWQPVITNLGRMLSFFHSVRLHFAAIVGAISAWILWPKRNDWKKSSDFRSVVFLSLLLISLMLMHMWAALGKDYCVYCLAGYTAFFSVTGILIFIISFSTWQKQLSWWQQTIIILFILVFSAGIGYGAFEDIGEQLLRLPIPQWLLGSSSPGYAELNAVLINKFSLEYSALRRQVPMIFALGLGLTLLLGVFLIYVVYSKRKKSDSTHQKSASYGYWALATFLFVGILLSPTLLLAGGYEETNCQGDIIKAYEQAGAHLAQNIPPGATVFWKGGLSIVPLLYIPEAQVYPPQINDGYSYFDGGDPDTLLKYGAWNEELARQWADEADFILLEERSFKGWLRDHVTSSDFVELGPTPDITGCRDDSQIKIFKRVHETTSK